MAFRGFELRLAQILLIALCAASVFGDFLSSNPPDAQNLGRFFAPPSRVHFITPDGTWQWQPFVHPLELVDPLDGTYREDVTRTAELAFLGRGYKYEFLGLIPSSLHLVVTPDSAPFCPLGTDELGRDLAARVLAGARTSLAIVTIGILFYTSLGFAIGALAAWVGGWIDSILMRLSEFMMALPALYLLLALRAVLPVEMPYWRTLSLIAGTIAAVTWPPMARGVRGLMLRLSNAPYVEAARSLGCTNWQIFSQHILPRLPGFMLAQMVVAAPAFLLGELVLSFLDVGVRGSGESWGAMLRSLKDPRILTDFWWNLAPLGFVFLTLFCLNLVASSLDES